MVSRKCSHANCTEDEPEFYISGTRCKACRRKSSNTDWQNNKRTEKRRIARNAEPSQTKELKPKKVCSRCRCSKYLSLFPEWHQSPDGRRKQCNVCTNANRDRNSGKRPRKRRGHGWKPSGNQYEIKERFVLVAVKAAHYEGNGYSERYVKAEHAARLIQEGAIRYSNGYYHLAAPPLVIDHILDTDIGWLSPAIKLQFDDAIKEYQLDINS